MDNIEWTMQSPQEDEFALCVLTLKSPCMGWFFPKRRDHYDRYLTFRDVHEHERKIWQSALLDYFTRLTWKYNLPLVCKSPPHTARIRWLLDIFPEAKFVHIRPDPYAVFVSTRKMLKTNFDLHCLQRPPIGAELDDWIIRQYRAMHDVFFEDRKLIPAGRYYELSFEQLEKNPVGELIRVYEALSLPDFSEVRPAIERYVEKNRGYQKNEFPQLSASQTERLSVEWRRCFDEWGYSRIDDIHRSHGADSIFQHIPGIKGQESSQ